MSLAPAPNVSVEGPLGYKGASNGHATMNRFSFMLISVRLSARIAAASSPGRLHPGVQSPRREVPGYDQKNAAIRKV